MIIILEKIMLISLITFIVFGITAIASLVIERVLPLKISLLASLTAIVTTFTALMGIVIAG